MSVFYKKLLNKIQNGRPEDVSSFIENNGLDVVQTLEKTAIIPISYEAKVKNENVDLKSFPLIYIAVLNEKYSLEMVRWLHKHMPISIITAIVDYRILSEAPEEKKAFYTLTGSLDYDYVTHAQNNNKAELLNYLLSFHREDSNGEFPNLLDDVPTETKELFMAQKSLFENKNYQALMDAMEESTLVYSVIELAKDKSFMTFCQANGSELVKLYMDNATYELGFSDPYFFAPYLNDPELKDKARKPEKMDSDVPQVTGETKRSVQENSMFNSNSMLYVAGGVAVAGLAAYYLSNMRK